MSNSNVATRIPLQTLADGQVWQMAELNLQVGMVGKLLVHYKLAKPNAVRIPNLVGSIATVEKYLKKNKAILAAPKSNGANGTKTNGSKTNGTKKVSPAAVKATVPAKKKK